MPKLINGLEFPDDATDEEVLSFFEANQGLVASHETDAEPSEERTWTDTAVDALPMVGGSIGGLLGLVGGPAGAVGGAVLGGAGGEGWRQNINRLRGKKSPTSAGEAAKDIAVSGGVQGASEAAGGLIGKGLTKGAPALYRSLLKPGRAIQSEFGGDEVVRTLIDEGALITRGGADKMAKRLAASSAEGDKLVAKFGPGSTFVQPKEVLSEFGDVVRELRNRVDVGQRNELGKVGERGRRLVATLSRGVDGSKAQTLKRTAQSAASGAYKQLERGGIKELSADDLLDAATARGYKKAVEARVPGMAERNAKTQALMGGSRALDEAVEARANNNAVGGARDMIAAGTGAAAGAVTTGGTGLAAGLLTRMLASPRMGSGAAILMDRTGKNVPLDELIRMLTFAAQESGR